MTALDPTLVGDLIAERMRAFYEANRETWRERRKQRWTSTADNLMLGLLSVALSANQEFSMTPSPDRRREAIARIIDPWSWHHKDRGSATKSIEEHIETSLKQADAILSSDLGEGMGIRKDVNEALTRAEES